MASTPIQFNALAVLEAAYLDLGVTQPGETLGPDLASVGLARLNALVSSLALMPLTFPFITREVFTVTANQGTYTVGPDGDFDTIRPTALKGAGLLMPSGSGTIEIPIPLMTEAQYQGAAAKAQTSTMWTSVYYTPTYSGGLGTLFLWPTPTGTTYQVVLYRADQIQGFANLTTLYDFPEGYFELLQFSLMKRLARPTGTVWTPDMEADRREALALVKRNNFKLADTAIDGTLGRGGFYNIETGI